MPPSYPRGRFTAASPIALASYSRGTNAPIFLHFVHAQRPMPVHCRDAIIARSFSQDPRPCSASPCSSSSRRLSPPPLLPPNRSAPTPVALHCGHLFDANAGKLLGETTIITDGKRIKDVKAGPRRRARRADRRARQRHLPARPDRQPHASDQPDEPDRLHRPVPLERRRLRDPLDGLRASARSRPASRPCATSATATANRLRCATRSTPASCPGPRIFSAGRRHRFDRRPCRRHRRLPQGSGRRSRPEGRHHQRPRRRVESRAPALQGRRRRHQDHAVRRRARRKLQRRQRADDDRRDQGGRRGRARLRIHGRRARARRRGDPPRGHRRRRFDRARHVHGRCRHEAHEGARHLVRADDHRRQVRRGKSQRAGLLPGAGRGQGEDGRTDHPGRPPARRTRPASRSRSAPMPPSIRTARTRRSSSTWSRPACRPRSCCRPRRRTRPSS